MNILAIGAHIGDTELMAGPYLCQLAMDGASCFMLALTSGEKGNPEVEPNKYKQQKLEEASEFSKKSGIPYEVYADIPDAHLFGSEMLVQRVINTIKNKEITQVITHWRGSFHPDHRQAHDIVSQAVLRINLQLKGENQISIRFCENWEDVEGFTIDEYAEISESAVKKWKESIEHEEFIYGDFSKFRYFNYYQALLTIRGCLSGNDFAVAFKNEKLL